MSELQIGLLAIGALVVAGVFAYNRVQERGAGRVAKDRFRSDHSDALLDEPAAGRVAPVEAPRTSARVAPAPEKGLQPDPAIDYIVDLELEQPQGALIQEQWPAIERRHARRALLGSSADGLSWRAGLQLVSRDGAIGEAELIEFRSAVETLASAVGARVTAPEMKVAVDAARELDDFCAEADVQVVVNVVGGPFPGTKVRAAAEAAGLALEDDGRFALRNDAQQLLYALADREGLPFGPSTMKDAAPGALSLSLDVACVPDTRRSFESMARLAGQLASVLGGRVVDDNGSALDERGMAAIALQLDTVREKLVARGISPGGPAALRLFS